MNLPLQVDAADNKPKTDLLQVSHQPATIDTLSELPTSLTSPSTSSDIFTDDQQGRREKSWALMQI